MQDAREQKNGQNRGEARARKGYLSDGELCLPNRSGTKSPPRKIGYGEMVSTFDNPQVSLLEAPKLKLQPNYEWKDTDLSLEKL